MWAIHFAVIGIAVMYLVVVFVYSFYIAPWVLKLPNYLRILAGVLTGGGLMVGAIYLQCLVDWERPRKDVADNFVFAVVIAELICAVVIMFTAAYIFDKNGTYDKARRYRKDKGYK